MALEDRVRERIALKRLVQLTNLGDNSKTTEDVPTHALAAQDAEAMFEMRVGRTYDETDNRDVMVAVEGVIAFLQDRAGHGGDKVAANVDKWETRLIFLAKVTARDRMTSKTNAVATPTPENQGSNIVRPFFDSPLFADLIPGEPSAGEARVDLD